MSVKSSIGDPLVTVGSEVSVDTIAVVGGEDRPNPETMSVEWFLTDSLRDTAGVYDSGQPSFVPVIEGVPGRWLVSLSASFRLPNTLNPRDYGSRYYIEWMIRIGDTSYSEYEEFDVHPSITMQTGLQNGLTMIDYPMPVRGVLQNVSSDDVQPDVRLSFRTDDNLSIADVVLSPDMTQSGGGLIVYEHSLDLGVGENTWSITDSSGQSTIVINPEFQENIGQSFGGRYRLPTDPPGEFTRPWMRRELVKQRASLDPVFCSWSWEDGPKQGQFIGFSRYWFFNEQLFTLAESTRQLLERAFIKDGALERVFDDGEYADFLRMGRDLYNSIPQTTTFDMSKPEGPMQSDLLTCVRYLAGQARKLEEGLKMVDFGGQSTSANVDFSQHYSDLVADTEGRFDAIRDRKRDLALVGLTEGDGSIRMQKKQTSPKGLGLTLSTVGNAANNFYFYPYGTYNSRRSI